MKTKLTKDDVAGWYVCDGQKRQYCRYWDCVRLRLDPCGMDCCSQYTNFRRLIEYVEPVIIEGDDKTALTSGMYWRQGKEGNVFPYTEFHNGKLVSQLGSRYIRIPEPVFPHREEPDPPKPELYLVNVNGNKHWAFKVGDALRFEDGNWIPFKHAEIIKPTE